MIQGELTRDWHVISVSQELRDIYRGPNHPESPGGATWNAQIAANDDEYVARSQLWRHNCNGSYVPPWLTDITMVVLLATTRHLTIDWLMALRRICCLPSEEGFGKEVPRLLMSVGKVERQSANETAVTFVERSRARAMRLSNTIRQAQLAGCNTGIYEDQVKSISEELLRGVIDKLHVRSIKNKVAAWWDQKKRDERTWENLMSHVQEAEAEYTQEQTQLNASIANVVQAATYSKETQDHITTMLGALGSSSNSSKAGTVKLSNKARNTLSLQNQELVAQALNGTFDSKAQTALVQLLQKAQDYEHYAPEERHTNLATEPRERPRCPKCHQSSHCHSENNPCFYLGAEGTGDRYEIAMRTIETRGSQDPKGYWGEMKKFLHSDRALVRSGEPPRTLLQYVEGKPALKHC